MRVSTAQHQLNFGPPHSNRGLFSDHFLNDDQRLKAMPHWRDAEGVAEALAQTDALIDRTVYALYGLTEEEIAIVEGGPGGRGE